jgi:hypothetical protein
MMSEQKTSAFPESTEAQIDRKSESILSRILRNQATDDDKVEYRELSVIRANRMARPVLQHRAR